MCSGYPRPVSKGIPKEARELIGRHIHSVAQLELLLYVRERAGEHVTADGVSRAQKISAEMAADLLSDLAARGFVSGSEQGYVYDVKPSLARGVDALAGAYGTYRVAIINLIFTGPSESIRNFADAFRLRRDEE